MWRRDENHARNSVYDLQFSPSPRFERTNSVSSVDENSLTDDELTEKLRQYEKEIRLLRGENLLFSRYLRRVQSSKIVQSFDEFDDDDELVVLEKSISSQKKFPQIVRRWSNRASLTTSNLWSRLATSRRDSTLAWLLLRVAQEKLAIAAYEVEQTELDWQRMKNNAQQTFDDLEVQLSSLRSDARAEQLLQHELHQSIDQLKIKVGQYQSMNRNSTLPAEVLLHRIQKRIFDRTTSIGVLNIDTTRAQTRIHHIDHAIITLDRLRERMDEIDIRFVRARKMDVSERFENVERQYKIDKASQYPMLRQANRWKELARHAEKQQQISKKKVHFLESYLAKLNDEIQSIEEEMKSMSKENENLAERLADIERAPSITDYARVIENGKNLQHAIEIWTRRVQIAEKIFSQMKRQNAIEG